MQRRRSRPMVVGVDPDLNRGVVGVPKFADVPSDHLIPNTLRELLFQLSGLARTHRRMGEPEITILEGWWLHGHGRLLLRDFRLRAAPPHPPYYQGPGRS